MQPNSFSDVKRSDEYQSFLVRIWLGLYAGVFSGVGILFDYFQIKTEIYWLTASTFLLITFLLFFDLFRRLESTPRRYLTLFIDISYASCTIYLTASGTSFVWLLYVLLYIGFGARYGARFVHVAATITLIQYNCLLLFTDLWSTVPLDLISQMLVLSFLPLYLNSLFLRLHIARTEAEKLTQLKSKFLASMTHEIRTPLNGIIGVTRLLENTVLDDIQQKYIQALSYSSNLLHGLIDDILDFSKIEANKFEINTSVFNIRDCVTQVAESLIPKAPNNKQIIRVNIGSTIPKLVMGDKQRIQQVLVNLINNALKSTDVHTGQIDLNLMTDTSNSQDIILIKFEVVDNGIGIDKKAQKTIFDNYTQVIEANNHFVINFRAYRNSC